MKTIGTHFHTKGRRSDLVVCFIMEACLRAMSLLELIIVERVVRYPWDFSSASRRCPNWVKNGSGGASKLCLRYPTKQTSTPATATSVSCHDRTSPRSDVWQSKLTREAFRRTVHPSLQFGV